VLSPAELAAIQLEISANLPLQQDLAAALLPDTCLVYRDTPGRSLAGQPIVVADPSPRTIACRVSPTGGGDRERAVAERLIDVNTWDIAMPAGTDITNPTASSTRGSPSRSSPCRARAASRPSAWSSPGRSRCDPGHRNG
jgi:hypothetical protein